MNQRQRLLLAAIVGSILLLPLIKTIALGLWPFDPLPELHAEFATGIAAAQFGLLAAWFVFANCTLVERVVTATLTLFLLRAWWDWRWWNVYWHHYDDVHFWGEILSTELLWSGTAATAALVAMLPPNQRSLTLPRRAAVLVVGIWFAVDQVIFNDHPRQYENLIWEALGVAYFGTLLTFPMWLLKWYQGWRIEFPGKATEPTRENLTTGSRTFSLAQLLGWMTLAAVVTGILTRAASKSESSLERVNASELLELLVPTTMVASFFGPASAALLGAVLITPRWRVEERGTAIACVLLVGVVLLPAMEILQLSSPLAALIPFPTFILFFTGTLVVLRRIGFHMPRAQSTQLEERSE